MDSQQQKQAETLWREWKAKKKVECLRGQVKRAAEAYKRLAEGLESEVGNDQERHEVRRYRTGAGFTVQRINTSVVGGEPKQWELLGVEQLQALTDG